MLLLLQLRLLLLRLLLPRLGFSRLLLLHRAFVRAALGRAGPAVGAALAEPATQRVDLVLRLGERGLQRRTLRTSSPFLVASSAIAADAARLAAACDTS